MTDKKTKKSFVRSKKRKNDLPKRARFNSVDVFILVVVVLCVIGVGLRDTIADIIIKDDPYTPVDIYIYAEDLTPAQLTQIKQGDTLLVNDVSFGTVEDIQPNPAKNVIEKVDEKGVITLVEVVDNDHYSVLLKVSVEGRYTENGLYIQDNLDLYVGKILNISAPSYSLTVTITEIPRI